MEQIRLKETTLNYIDLSSQSFELALEATTTATNRVLGYVKSNFEIVSKPLTATTPEAIVNESIERTTKLVALREAYLKETGKHAAAFANDVVENAKQWQDAAQSALKGVGDITASNVAFVSKQVANASKN